MNRLQRMMAAVYHGNFAVSGMSIIARMGLTRRIGKSPIGGYLLWDIGPGFELQAVMAKDGKAMNQCVRLPKDPDQLRIVLEPLLAHAYGSLSALAIEAERKLRQE